MIKICNLSRSFAIENSFTHSFMVASETKLAWAVDGLSLSTDYLRKTVI